MSKNESLTTAAEEIHQQIARVVENDVVPALVDQLSRGLQKALHQARRGESLYIPQSLDRVARNAAIRQEYSGPQSLPGIMKKYGVSRATVYRVIGDG